MKGPALPAQPPRPTFPTFPLEIGFLRRAQGYTLQRGPTAWAARHGCPPHPAPGAPRVASTQLSRLCQPEGGRARGGGTRGKRQLRDQPIARLSLPDRLADWPKPQREQPGGEGAVPEPRVGRWQRVPVLPEPDRTSHPVFAPAGVRRGRLRGGLRGKGLRLPPLKNGGGAQRPPSYSPAVGNPRRGADLAPACSRPPLLEVSPLKPACHFLLLPSDLYVPSPGPVSFTMTSSESKEAPENDSQPSARSRGTTVAWDKYRKPQMPAPPASHGEGGVGGAGGKGGEGSGLPV